MRYMMKVARERDMDLLPHLSHMAKFEKRNIFKAYFFDKKQVGIWTMGELQDMLNEIELFERIRYTSEKELVTTLIRERVTLINYLGCFPYRKDLRFFERLFDGSQFSCVKPSQYSFKNGGDACTGICLAAAYYFFDRAWVFYPLEMPWESIITYGIKIWKSVFDKSKNKTVTYQTFIEVYKDEQSTIIQSKLRPYTRNSELCGRLFSEGDPNCNTVSIEETFAILQSMEEDAVLLLSIKVFTFAVFFTKSDPKNLWFFDSHGNFCDGKSDVIRFNRIDSLVMYLKWYFANLQKCKSEGFIGDTFSSVLLVSNEVEKKSVES